MLVLVINIDEPGLDGSWIAYDVLLVYDIVLGLFMSVSRCFHEMYHKFDSL